jgi:hypothetical protein
MKFGPEEFYQIFSSHFNSCRDRTIVIATIKKTYRHFYTILTHNLLNNYYSKKCFGRTFVQKLKHILHSIYFFYKYDSCWAN